MTTQTTRDETIKQIRQALKNRTGRTWSVTGGRGTSWGWINITAPPRRMDGWAMSAADQLTLSDALDKTVHHQGESIPASNAHYQEFIERAEGRPVTAIAEAYWD